MNNLSTSTSALSESETAKSRKTKIQREDEIHMTMDSFVKAPSASLPDGWEWHCWGDGSGSLQAPDGRSFFRYDCIPYANSGEIEYYRDESSSSYWTFVGNLESFKKFAEERIRELLNEQTQ